MCNAPVPSWPRPPPYCGLARQTKTKAGHPILAKAGYIRHPSSQCPLRSSHTVGEGTGAAFRDLQGMELLEFSGGLDSAALCAMPLAARILSVRFASARLRAQDRSTPTTAAASPQVGHRCARSDSPRTRRRSDLPMAQGRYPSCSPLHPRQEESTAVGEPLPLVRRVFVSRHGVAVPI